MTGRLIYDEQERLLAWADEQIGGAGQFRSEAVAIGYEMHGELRAVVVYEAFTPHDCDVHIAIAKHGRGITRGVMAAAFAYPFVQLGLRRITGRVPESRVDAIAFDEHLGFVREGYHPHAAGDEGVVTLGLLRENCKFLNKG